MLCDNIADGADDTASQPGSKQKSWHYICSMESGHHAMSRHPGLLTSDLSADHITSVLISGLHVVSARVCGSIE
jgi:hypothetical protein